MAVALKNTITDEHLKGAVDVLANLVRSVQLKRALTGIEPDPGLNFWRVIYGNLTDIAVIDWCKLFGSDDEDHQQVHWKNVFVDQDAFRAGLLQFISLPQSGFETYWREMKSYRDRHAAHLDFDKPRPDRWPSFDHALPSSYYYYAQMLPALRARGMTRYPDDLKSYGEAFLIQAREIGAIAVPATKDIHERVG
jgi:hypothetical protein